MILVCPILIIITAAFLNKGHFQCPQGPFFRGFTVCIFASSVQWTASRRAKINEDSDICNDGRNGSAAWFGDYPLVSPETRMIATRLIRLERDVVCRKLFSETSSMLVTLLSTSSSQW